MVPTGLLAAERSHSAPLSEALWSRFPERSTLPSPVASTLHGVRLSFTGDLSGMVLRMQVDVGFGDAVVPTRRERP